MQFQPPPPKSNNAPAIILIGCIVGAGVLVLLIALVAGIFVGLTAPTHHQPHV